MLQQGNNLSRAASNLAAQAGQHKDSDLLQDLSDEAINKLLGQRPASPPAQEQPAAGSSLAGGVQGAAPQQSTQAADTSGVAAPTVQAAQQAVAQPQQEDTGAAAGRCGAADETTTTAAGPYSPSKVAAAVAPVSPCFKTPAAAEVLAMQLPAAAAALALAPRQRPAASQPKRQPALRRQRSQKPAASKGHSPAKRSYQRRAPLPPSLLPQPSAATAERHSTHEHGAFGAGTAEQHNPPRASDARDAPWQQHADAAAQARSWRQPQAQPLPPSLWEAMAALQYGSLQLPQQRQEQRLQPQQQHWLLVPPPAFAQQPPQANAAWYDAVGAGLQQARQDSGSMYRQTLPAQRSWRPVQPQEMPGWQDDVYRPVRAQALPAASAAPTGMGFWGGQLAAAADDIQQRHATASQPAPTWPHRPAVLHSTAISVAPPSMQMVLQPAEAAERRPQQPGCSAGLWQAAAMSSAAVGPSGSGSWAAWRPPAQGSQQP